MVVLGTSGVTMAIYVDTGGLESLVRGRSGESFQVAFEGQGLVLAASPRGRLVWTTGLTS